ncbi:hypothetical protein QFZ27_003423 [Inquilinus ginsengisoli]|uniref:hypothetical protein n=1 Tax=Inquilinus ginsengisoli TaxID=363840 RepID=UPI003D232963
MKPIHTPALIFGLALISACSDSVTTPPAIASSASSPPTPVAASTQACDSYLGQMITPVSFDRVRAALSRLPTQRNEFETTPQFDARVANALGNTDGTYIVQAAFNPKYATYDADRQQFAVQTYAIGHGQPYWDTVFGYGHPLYGQVEYGSYENIGLSVSSSETAGTYVGSNAFGVTARVTETTRNEKAIFDRKAAYGEDLYSPPGSDVYSTRIIAEIPADPATAPRLKNTMKAAVVIAPRSPWVAAGRGHINTPTINNPQTVEQVVSAVIADIQCALITDGTNKVIAAVTTR